MFVAMPLLGVLAVILITFLTLQKTRLQTKLDDSNWWLINYSDITILAEPKVGFKFYAKKKKKHGPIWYSHYFCFFQGGQALSLNTTPSKSGSGGSQTMISTNSFGLKDKNGKETVYATIGLYQVQSVKESASPSQVIDTNLPFTKHFNRFVYCNLTLDFIMSKGNHVSIKYLDNQLLRDIKKPSIIAEFNVVKTNTSTMSYFNSIPIAYHWNGFPLSYCLMFGDYQFSRWRSLNMKTWYSFLEFVTSPLMSALSCNIAKKAAWR